MKKSIILKLSMAICLLITACQKDDQTTEQSFASPKTVNGCVVLGERIPDPYSLTYMVPAFANMKQTGIDFPFNQIEPTGYYVKVLVDNDSVKDILTSDSSIVWFDYPLDYEVSEHGYYYEEAGCVGDQKYLYAIVPVGYTLMANCKSITLDSVFIPSDYPIQGAYEKALDILEDEAYRLAGDTANSGAKSSNKVYRRATIKAWDDRLEQLVPLQGVRVKFKQHSKSCWGITNSNGVAISDKKFKSQYGINYSIEWYRANWQIRKKLSSGKIVDAIYTGPFLYSDWALSITHGMSPTLMHASVHKALLLTYYSSLWTIEKPSRNFGGKIRVVCVDGESDFEGQWGQSSCYGHPSKEYATIWRKEYGNPVDLTTDIIMAATLHEMAHWSQYKRLEFAPLPSNCITESWADCVMWYIMTHYYHIPYTGYRGGKQNWVPSMEPKAYSPLFIDLIDNYNQSLNGGDYPNDVISGYSLKFIQDSIIQDNLLYSSVKSNMYQHKKPGVTDAQLDQLLYKYNQAFGDN